MVTSIVATLQKSPLGVDCSPQELVDLAHALEIVDLPQHAVLFEVGASADAAYVLLEGVLEVRSETGELLNRVGPGTLVGEQALMAGGRGTRNASVHAPELARLLRVEAPHFSTLAKAGTQRRAQIEAGSLARTLDRLSRSAGPLKRLLDASTRRHFSEGELIFEEGDPADGLHLVLAGRAEVVRATDGAPAHLCTVYPGAVFGELATLRGEPRAASVIARQGLATAFVALDQALELNQHHPDLEAFLRSLLRSYDLPSLGTVDQRSVQRAGRTCIETVYTLEDGRELRALRTPEGHYTLARHGAQVAKEMTLAQGTQVRLDAEHRIVGLEDQGQYADLAGLQTLVLEGTPLSIQQRRTLRKAAREAAQRAPEAVICHCLKLQRATLQAAIDAGAHTPAALCQQTGCGSVCGGCMKQAVPQLFEGGPPAPALELPAPTGTALPRMPRLIPWLGNFSLSRDPAGFQRRGHARLGPLFGAHLMGIDWVFVDPRAKGGVLREVLESRSEMDGPAAWRTVCGALFGEDRVSQPPVLALDRLPAACGQAVDQVLERHLQPGPVDLLRAAEQAVAAGILALCGTPGHSLPELGEHLGTLCGDLSAIDALQPLQTPARRRRLQARAALEAQLDATTLATLLAAHRNASLACVATWLAVQNRPKLAAKLRQESGHRAPSTLRELRARPLLQACLQEAVRVYGGGGLWRRVQAPVQVAGISLPQGALIGTLTALHDRPEGHQDFAPEVTRPVFGTASTGVFDEGFGSRPPAHSLPEAMAMLVLSRLVRPPEWSVRIQPKRWATPILPGMGRPIGGVQAWMR